MFLYAGFAMRLDIETGMNVDGSIPFTPNYSYCIAWFLIVLIVFVFYLFSSVFT